jgi:pimeloyl-ACP methyl ester carboxylesterase
MLFAHGFGCDHNMWRLLVPAFADRFGPLRLVDPRLPPAEVDPEATSAVSIGTAPS